MVLLLLLLHVPLFVTQQVAEPPPGCGVYHKNFTVTPQWQKLFAAGRNLTEFYQNPLRGYGPGHEMVRTAMIYLEQLEELEHAVDENRSTALDAVWELYLCGGPLHLRRIPYGEFIRLFKWDSTDIAEYFTLINDTRKIWNRLIEELQRIADPDLIV